MITLKEMTVEERIKDIENKMLQIFGNNEQFIKDAKEIVTQEIKLLKEKTQLLEVDYDYCKKNIRKVFELVDEIKIKINFIENALITKGINS